MSVEYLERIASRERPPLKYSEIEEKKSSLDQDNTEEVRKSLEEMEEAFKKPGDLSSWQPELLDDIDAVFVKTYVGKGGELHPTLFFPRAGTPDCQNKFREYCTGSIRC
jgi:hypothetical protein